MAMIDTWARRRLLCAAIIFAAGPALAQAPASPALGVAPQPSEALAPPPPGAVRVNLQTAQGLIVLDLYADKAPITAANFLRYVDQKRFDGITFYRASKAPGAPQFGVIQGGVQNDPARVLKPIAHESTVKTGLKHVDGTISMGRHAPGTATSDFFICIGESSYLDANPSSPGDNQGFAAFGQVVQGMEVVKAILALPVDPVGGPPGMKGEMLKPPVRIVAARRAG
jgi:peptidyl-prolyl cis-trans isomerase A (cyclophilin A)